MGDVVGKTFIDGPSILHRRIIPVSKTVKCCSDQAYSSLLILRYVVFLHFYFFVLYFLVY